MRDITITTNLGNWARLIEGDCRVVLPTLEGVDCVVTDPPYGTEDYGGGYGRRELHTTDGKRTIENDRDLSAVAGAWSYLIDLVPCGWLAIFFSAKRTPDFIKATSSELWHGEIVWDKCAPGLGYHIRYQHESIALFRVGEPERPTNALLSIIRCSYDARLHPHEKPIPVLQRLLDFVSKPKQTVLDPFMGSGTTLIAALRTGRNAIGIEISPKFFDVALKRVKAEAAQTRMFA